MYPTIDFYYTNLWQFIPREKINENEKWIKHVRCNGARFHILSWLLTIDGKGVCRCSEPDCIYNKEE